MALQSRQRNCTPPLPGCAQKSAISNIPLNGHRLRGLVLRKKGGNDETTPCRVALYPRGLIRGSLSDCRRLPGSRRVFGHTATRGIPAHFSESSYDTMPGASLSPADDAGQDR